MKSIAKKVTSYLGAAAALLIVFAILFAMADYHNWFNKKDVELTLAAQVYEDGVPVEDSFIEIEGVYHHNFWKDESFRGDFRVEAFPETLREDVSAVIWWQSFTWEDENGKKQKRVDPFILLYRYSFLTDIADQGYNIYITNDMTEIAWKLPDGRIVATSEAAYDAYVQE